MDLIPPGTKGTIRGNKFNEIVKSYIQCSSIFPADTYNIDFEKKCPIYETHEIPDWYIWEKSTNKIIIGMNQLDLWSGGQQLNRFSKYMDMITPSKQIKIVCVVCNEIKFTSEKSKAYKLFQRGFKKNTLCYLKNLRPIIQDFYG